MATPAQKILGGLVVGGVVLACTRIVTKGGKTYQIETVTTTQANQIALDNYNRRVREINERNATRS